MDPLERRRDDPLLRGGRRRARSTSPPSAVAVRIRPQTPEEERQFHAAVRLFLLEIVRQQLDRPKEDP